MSSLTKCYHNNLKYKDSLKNFYESLESFSDCLTYSEHFSKITGIPYKTVLRWCKKGKIKTEYVRIIGRKVYTISIKELPYNLKYKYLTNLYKLHGIETKDLKTARHQYHRKLIWGTTDLSLSLDQLIKLQKSKNKVNKDRQSNALQVNTCSSTSETKENAQLAIVTYWLKFRHCCKEEGINYKKADRLFLNLYNNAENHPKEKEIIGCIGSISKLRRWKKKHYNNSEISRLFSSNENRRVK